MKENEFWQILGNIFETSDYIPCSDCPVKTNICQESKTCSEALEKMYNMCMEEIA